MSPRVTYDLEDSIATITLNDGKMNALSNEMLAEINGALDRAAADRAIVILTGREGVFSAGFDLRVLKAGGAAAVEMFIAGFRLGERILSFPAPVIIAAPGHTLAMGAFLLASADYRVGAAGPYKVGVNEVAIGITMPHFGVEICRQRLAPSYFHRAVLTAEIYSPAEAVTAGFLDAVVPAAELRDAARHKAAELATLDMGAHEATKLRARGPALQAVRSAIEADDRELQALLG
jgi:enoyl-CoA hydratase